MSSSAVALDLVQRLLDGHQTPPYFEIIAARALREQPAITLADIVRADAVACGRQFQLVPSVQRYESLVDPATMQPAALEVAHQVIAAAGIEREHVCEGLARTRPTWREALSRSSAAASLARPRGAQYDLPIAVGPPIANGNLRYRILEVIGAGSSGVVAAATDQLLGATKPQSEVVVKFIASRSPTDSPWEAEAARVAAITHPCGVRVIDFGRCDGLLGYLVLERVVGRSLVGRQAAGERMALTTAVAAVADLAEALEELHAAGIAHGDISPANIMVDRFDRLRLLDFGLACPIDEEARAADLLRLDELLSWLTAGYIAPTSHQRRPRCTTAIEFSHVLRRRLMRRQQLQVWALVVVVVLGFVAIGLLRLGAAQ